MSGMPLIFKLFVIGDALLELLMAPFSCCRQRIKK
jgi:hypothetical protein